MISFERINVGDTYTYKINYSDEIHNSFKDFSGDDSPIHTSLKFANNNSYKKPLGYAFFLPSIISRVFGKYFPGGNELCLNFSVDFRNPFFIGDEITFNFEVSRKIAYKKTIEITIMAHNANHCILSGKSMLSLILD